MYAASRSLFRPHFAVASSEILGLCTLIVRQMHLRCRIERYRAYSTNSVPTAQKGPLSVPIAAFVCVGACALKWGSPKGNTIARVACYRDTAHAQACAFKWDLPKGDHTAYVRKHMRVKVGTPKECTPHVCVSTHVHACEASVASVALIRCRAKGA